MTMVVVMTTAQIPRCWETPALYHFSRVLARRRQPCAGSAAAPLHQPTSHQYRHVRWCHLSRRGRGRDCHKQVTASMATGTRAETLALLQKHHRRPSSLGAQSLGRLRKTVVVMAEEGCHWWCWWSHSATLEAS